MVGTASLGDFSLLTWLALLVTAVGVLLLARYVGEIQEIVATVDAAVSPERLPVTGFIGSINKAGRQVMITLSEAASILEGDRGLLWLTAFLAVLLFMISR